jgi:hypothetical protein
VEQLESRLLLSTLTTDKTNYDPGATATFTGAGFGANETVDLQVARSDGTNYSLSSVMDDSAGNFTTTWTLPTDAAGFSFTATATGETSHLSAQATFFGNNPLPTITSLGPTSGPEGSGSFTLTVNGTNFINSSVVEWNGTNLTTTFVSSAQLTASVPPADVAEEGSASVTVFNPPPGGGTSNAQAFTINDQAVAATGTGFNWIEGSFFTTTVATFTDPGGAESIGDYNASINWGDGTTSTGTITGPDSHGVFSVLGSHTYADGTFTFTVTINHDLAPSVTATATAVLADVPPRVGADQSSVTAAEGATATNTGTWSDFDDAVSLTASGGTVTENADGTWSWSQSDLEEGTSTVTITATNALGSTAQTSFTLTVTDPAVAATGATINWFEGSFASLAVATFTDPGGPEAVGNYSATIDWGDGSTTTGVTPTLSGTTFTVAADHTYAEERTYSIQVTIGHELTPSVTVNSTAVISDLAVNPTGGFAFSAVEGALSSSQTLATFTDPGGAEALADYSANIAWGDNSTSAGTITYDTTTGTFTVSGSHTYAEESSYEITVTLSHDTAPAAVATDTASVGDAALTGSSGASLSSTENVAGSLTLATFTDANSGAPASDFLATIGWGDGTTTPGVVSGSGGSYSVAGTHTYAEDGGYSLTITVTDAGSTATITGTAQVADAPLAAGTAAVNGGTEGITPTSLTATFTDANTTAPTADFTATIIWDDGTTTSGVVSGSGGSYSVAGTHTYAEEGSYTIGISVKDAGGSTASLTATATVGDANLTPGTATIAAGSEGLAPADPTATFTDANTGAPASDFTANITWGDGATTSGTVTGSGGSFSVAGSHSYAEEGSYPVAINVTDAGGNGVMISGTAAVRDPAVLATGGVAFSAVQGTPSGSQVVATFTDPAGAETISDYSATIDWGDGTAASGADQITASNGVFSVYGSHNYAAPDSYTIQVTVHHDLAPDSARVNSVAVVTGAGGGSVTLTGTPVIAQQGIPFADVPVAGFTDTNPDDGPGNFTATIDWGDGTPIDTGAISQPDGPGTPFVIEGSHVYNLAGSETGAITLTDGSGQTTVASFDASVSQSVFVLNPCADNALTMAGNGSIDLPGTVAVDSSSDRAIWLRGNAQLTATNIDVLGPGDGEGIRVRGNASISGTITTGVFSPDPLAGLPGLSADDAAELTNYIALGEGQVTVTSGTETIDPGIYSSIKISGYGSLVLNPGTYLIEGGGLTVTGCGNLSGDGVFIYNAGSYFPDPGGSMGGITLRGNGMIDLTAETAGDYAGVVIFQARDNTRALALGGCAASGLNGIVYAPNALLTLQGYAQLDASLIVDELNVGGSSLLTQMAPGSDGGDLPGIANTLLAGDLNVYLNDPSGYFTADMQARIADEISAWDALLVPYNVTITEVNDPSLANLVIEAGATSACGSAASGVLGCYNGETNEITILEGWNWYAGADPSQIGAGQYDFATTIAHELGHALGLGGSASPFSPMNETLPAGVARRAPSVADLNIPEPPEGADPLTAAGGVARDNEALPVWLHAGSTVSFATDNGQPAAQHRAAGAGTLITGMPTSWSVQPGLAGVATTRLIMSQVSGRSWVDPALANRLVDQLFEGRLSLLPTAASLAPVASQTFDDLLVPPSANEAEAPVPQALPQSPEQHETAPPADPHCFFRGDGMLEPVEDAVAADLASPILLAVAVLGGWGAVREIADQRSSRPGR